MFKYIAKISLQYGIHYYTLKYFKKEFLDNAELKKRGTIFCRFRIEYDEDDLSVNKYASLC